MLLDALGVQWLQLLTALGRNERKGPRMGLVKIDVVAFARSLAIAPLRKKCLDIRNACEHDLGQLSPQPGDLGQRASRA